MKNYVVTALAYVGAVVGAGFISGQELAQFFIQFGILGLIGWTLILLVAVVGGSLCLQRFASARYASLDDLVIHLFGSKIAVAADAVTLGYLVGGIIIMLAGSGTLLAGLCHIPLGIAVIFVTTAMYFVAVGKGKRILSVNKYLVPFLIAATLLVTIKVLFSHSFLPNVDSITIANPSQLLPNWWISVVLYLGYNVVGALVSFINISKEITPKDGRYGGLLGGVVVGILGTLLIAAMLFTYPSWQTSDLPLVKVLAQELPWFYYIYAPAMIIAMFNVATNYSLGVAAFAEKKFKKDFRILSAGLLAVCGITATTGFSRLLGVIYPVFGILATLLAMWLILHNVVTFLAHYFRPRKFRKEIL